MRLHQRRRQLPIHAGSNLGRRYASDGVRELNPSTADADDPTIRRCIGFAKAMGCNALHVVNLYALRATQPADLWLAQDPVEPDNDRILSETIAAAAHEKRPVIAAWGAHARRDRVQAVCAMPGVERFTALKVTKNGSPGHPLYVHGSSVPQPWALS